MPRYPGVTSALGCVIADMRHDFVRTVNGLLDGVDMAELDREAAAFRDEGQGLLDRAGVGFEGRETLLEFDMSYLGQTHTVAVPVPVRAGSGASLGIDRETVRAAFEARYREVYGRVLEGLAIRVLNLRVTAVGKRPKFDLSILAPGDGASLAAADRGKRQVYVDGAWHEAGIYDRMALPVGTVVPGPAVLEQADATTFVEPDLEAVVDEFGNLLVRRKEAS